MMLPFVDWLPQQRWYAGRGRVISEIDATAVTPLDDDLDHVLLRVAFVDGDVHCYQVLVGWDHRPADDYVGIALIGESDGREGYDALYDERSARQLLQMIIDGRSVEALRFEAEPGAEFNEEVPARVIEGEQSNTSVVFDTSSILKLYRRIIPGVNPDLELSRVLGRADSPHVARLLGAIEGSDPKGEPLSLATVTEFARNSADGWSMAAASARDLLAAPDLRADEVGGDFAAEAHRLGEAVASVHATLGDELGRSMEPPPTDMMIERLNAAAGQVPELVSQVRAVTEMLRRATAPTLVQRIHGDLHLGQVLRRPDQWILIDFEGEPGRPMAERRRPDSPMRDVAGMLRSFDYAAYQLVNDDSANGNLDDRAQEWADRNRSAFCDGYASAAGFDPREDADLLTAYELDKAAYEAAYESRHRPSWRWIPLHSISRLLAPTGSMG
jgi:maltokinase